MKVSDFFASEQRVLQLKTICDTWNLSGCVSYVFEFAYSTEPCPLTLLIKNAVSLGSERVLALQEELTERLGVAVFIIVFDRVRSEFRRTELESKSFPLEATTEDIRKNLGSSFDLLTLTENPCITVAEQQSSTSPHFFRQKRQKLSGLDTRTDVEPEKGEGEFEPVHGTVGLRTDVFPGSTRYNIQDRTLTLTIEVPVALSTHLPQLQIEPFLEQIRAQLFEQLSSVDLSKKSCS